MDWKTLKPFVITAIVVLILVVIIYFAGKQAAKAGLKNAKLPSDLPGTDLTEAEREQVRGLANNLFNDMNGLNLGGHSEEYYKTLVSLSDKMFVAVYNDFNAIVLQNGLLAKYGSLVDWINDEEFSGFFTYTIESIKERFNRLNLR